jgi:type I restriction enzyme S subunit
MSEATADFRGLDRLVRPVDAKLTLRKDPSKPYVGLEHLPSRGAYLLGWEAASHSVSTNSVFSAGDVLFGKLRPNLRKCVSAPFDGYCSTDILVLRAREDIHAGFAARVFQSETVGAAAERTAIGTKMPRTSWPHLSGLEVFCPPFPEQERIAQILDNLEIAIQQTDAIIAKLKAVMQSLLHDLLTRGIDVNGEIRPPQPEAPNLYQDSPLGWLPKEWEYSKLGTRVSFLGGYGFPERFQNLREGEVPFFKVSDQSTPGNERELTSSNNYVSFECAANQGWKLLPKGGIAFAKVGAALLLNRRRILTQDSLVDNNMMVAVAQDGVQDNWLYWFLNSVDFSRFVQPGALPSVNQAQLSSIPVGFPRPAEQSAISDRLDESDKRQGFEMQELGKLLQLKAGLMDDLLTGRVRVTSLLREELQAGSD